MVDSEKIQETLDSSADSGPQRKPKNVWFVATLVLMVCLFAVALFHRNWIRAQWWAMLLANTENMVEQTYFANSMAAVGQKSMGATQRLARHERPAVRALAIHILDRIPDQDATQEIERLLTDKDLTVRSSAALAMAFKASVPGGEEILRRLIATARSENTNTATTAVTALERVHQPEAIKTLCIIAREHNAAEVRAQAVESLATWLRSVPEHLQSPADIPSEPCDPFVTLVEALTDSASFSGRLSFERQMDAITAQAIIAQATSRTHNIGIDLPETTNQASPNNDSTRTVAQIAAEALTRLTGEAISPKDALTETQRANLANRYRRLASLQKPPPMPDPEQILAAPNDNDYPR